jgi:hypothetical protein
VGHPQAHLPQAHKPQGLAREFKTAQGQAVFPLGRSREAPGQVEKGRQHVLRDARGVRPGSVDQGHAPRPEGLLVHVVQARAQTAHHPEARRRLQEGTVHPDPVADDQGSGPGKGLPQGLRGAPEIRLVAEGVATPLQKLQAPRVQLLCH